jgi:hypothetical protein
MACQTLTFGRPKEIMAKEKFSKTLIPIVSAALGLSAWVCILSTSPVGVRAAFAQTQAEDAELIQALAQLTLRKGYKDVALKAQICENLGLVLSRARGCLVYEVPYADKDGWNHVFNVFGEPGTAAIRVIIFKMNAQSASFYRSTMDAKLEGALIETMLGGNFSWSTIPANSPDAQNGFAAELAYWRAQKGTLEGEPDRN